MQPVSAFDILDPPTAPGLGLGEEVLVLLEAPAPTLGDVHPGPPAGEGIGGGEHEEEPVTEVVEADRGEQGDGEVCQAPEDDGDCGALGAGGGGVDLGGDEPGWDEPADAERGGGEEEDDGAGDADGGQGEVQPGAVRGEAAEDGEDEEGDGEEPGPVHQEPAPAHAVDQHPGKGQDRKSVV